MSIFWIQFYKFTAVWLGDNFSSHILIMNFLTSLNHSLHLTGKLRLYWGSRCRYRRKRIIMGHFSPWFSAIWALLFGFTPFVDAMHMEMMPTFTLDQRAIIPSKFAFCARSFKRLLANCTCDLRDIPMPSCNSDPFINFNFHFFLIF